MNEIATRTISGAVFVVVIVSALYLGSYTAFIVLSLFMTIGLLEFYKLFKNIDSAKPNYKIGTLSGVFIILSLSSPVLFHLPNYWMLLALVPFPVLLISELYRNSVTSIQDISVTLLSWIYITVPFFIIFIIGFTKGWEFSIGLFTIVWANDTFAYLTGKFFGKNKLFERISPKKTWEGTFGGIILAILTAFIYATYFNLDVTFWLISGLIIAISAIFGDLIQSLFKRTVRVKDTGTIMPGHGGVLDRFDAVIFAAPIFFVFIFFFYN